MSKEEIFSQLRRAGITDEQIKKEYKKAKKLVGELVDKETVAKLAAKNLGIDVNIVKDDKAATYTFTDAQLEHIVRVRDIFNEVLKDKVEEFSSKCKFCLNPIMMQRMGGESWKPLDPKTGEKHRCKKGMAYYKKLKEDEEKNK